MIYSLRDVDPRKIGANVAESRRRCRLTQAELADRLGVPRQTLIAIESGQRLPTPAQIDTISSVLKTSARSLLNLAVVDESLSVRFRSTRPNRAVENAIAALEDFGRKYYALEELGKDRVSRREPPVFDLNGVDDVDLAAEELASAERLRLGLGDGPLVDPRSVLEEDVGLKIFGIEQLVQTKVSGLFAYSSEIGPIIGFNPAEDARRTNTTICHEYAHFLSRRWEPEVTDYSATRRKDKDEMFADRFAACFLMPTTGVSRRFSEMKRGQGESITVAHLLLMAHMFNVSFEAMTRRLEEIGRIAKGTHTMLIERGLKPLEAERELGIQRSRRSMHNLPMRYVLLVARLYDKGDISEGDVVDYLKVDRLAARELLRSLGNTSGDRQGIDILNEPVKSVG